MLCRLRPCFRNICHAAERIAGLEHGGRFHEEDHGLGRPCDGRGRHGRGRAPGTGRLRLADELGCRVGAHDRREWLPFVVPAVRRAVEHPWLPNDLYRFEGSWSSTDLLADTRPTPEASTWVMTLIGFAGLGMAGYRSPRNPWRRSNSPRESLRDDLQSAATKISPDRYAGVDPKPPHHRPTLGSHAGIDERRTRRTVP